MIRRHLMALRLGLMVVDGVIATIVFLVVSLVRFGDGVWLSIWTSLGIDSGIASILRPAQTQRRKAGRTQTEAHQRDARRRAKRDARRRGRAHAREDRCCASSWPTTIPQPAIAASRRIAGHSACRRPARSRLRGAGPRARA